MLLTPTRVEQLHDERFHEIDLVGGRRRSWREWLMEPDAVGTRWAAAISLAWLVIFEAAVFLTPAPAEPNASVPVWASVVFAGFVALLGGTVAALSGGRRIGLLASVIAGGLALVDGAMCPLAGHHETIGAWWYLRMTGFTGLIGASLVALRQARPTATPTSG